MTLNLFRMEVMVERLFHSWHHFLFIPCRGVKTPAFIRMQQRRQHIRSAAHPAPRRHLQFDTRNRRIGAKHQQSRALGRLGLIDAGRTAPLRWVRWFYVSWDRVRCTANHMRQKPVPSLLGAVVCTAVSNGMHTVREALAGLRRQINLQHVSDPGETGGKNASRLQRMLRGARAGSSRRGKISL